MYVRCNRIFLQYLAMLAFIAPLSVFDLLWTLHFCTSLSCTLMVSVKNLADVKLLFNHFRRWKTLDASCITAKA
uniref:Small glutamine-rich tetratricopeptide repeat-containing protein alpha n=1 Tax=Rhizophora mucronata TaxID=61149 RepID=A0A2P2LG64_RHIMU